MQSHVISVRKCLLYDGFQFGVSECIVYCDYIYEIFFRIICRHISLFMGMNICFAVTCNLNSHEIWLPEAYISIYTFPRNLNSWIKYFCMMLHYIISLLCVSVNHNFINVTYKYINHYAFQDGCIIIRHVCKVNVFFSVGKQELFMMKDYMFEVTKFKC